MSFLLDMLECGIQPGSQEAIRSSVRPSVRLEKHKHVPTEVVQAFWVARGISQRSEGGD